MNGSLQMLKMWSSQGRALHASEMSQVQREGNHAEMLKL